MSGGCAVAIFVVSTVLSAGAVAVVRLYARRALIDVPNERSSHVHPTPRGGGIGVVAALLAAAAMLGDRPPLAVLGALAALCVLGAWDDHRPLSARSRLVVQALAVAASLSVMPPPDDLRLFAWQFPVPPWAFWAGSGLACMWMINLTNFMDGIDGIAGTQLLVGALAAWTLFVVVGASGWPPQLALATAGAALGFLGWNWPKARIFLGDSGSTVLGLAAWLLVWALVRVDVPLEVALLPFAPFVADGTATLLRRAMRREHLASPHRSHLYQRLAVAWGSHARVAALYGGLAIAGAVGSHLALARLAPSWLLVAAWSASFTALVVYASRRSPAVRVER